MYKASVLSNWIAKAAKAWLGNQNKSLHSRILDKKEDHKVESYRDNQHPKIRIKSKILRRLNFHNRERRGIAQIPLLCNGMPENHPQDLVILEVGPPGDTWTYSIERKRFAEKSEWFRAMLIGDLAPPPSDPPPTVTLQHVDKRAFDHLLKYLRGEPLNFHSVPTARSTLDVAHQLICPELARAAVDYIISNLSASTVLGVYHGLDLYVPDRIFASDDRMSRIPTAPPAPDDDVGEIAVTCSRLLSACYTVIDATPDDVLRREDFDELTAREVADIASRDQLRLISESVLFNALEKWAATECRRLGLEPTPSNKRRVLDDQVWYSVRYLCMTNSEFIEGPMRSGVLTPDESAFIATRILGHQPRHEVDRTGSFAMTSLLSTTPRYRTRNTCGRNSDSKPGKKERDDNKRNRRKECANQGHKTCARIGDCIIRVLACVFE